MTGFTDKELVDVLPKLKYRALRLTLDESSAEDLVSDTIIKALKYRDNFTNTIGLKPWLFTIMRNTFLTERRKDKFIGETYEDAELDIVAPSNLNARIELEEVLQFLTGIPEERSEAILLSAQGYTIEEMSNILGVTEGTIKSRIHRGLEVLKVFFDER
jgi:RNA polymerase sigma-70 factor (ECF subfamily)